MATAIIDVQVKLPTALLEGLRRAADGAWLETVFRQMLVDAEAEAKRLVSGPVLKVRTGRLRASIRQTVVRQGNILIGRLGSDVIYARIHELGGTIPGRTIRPVRAKALRFEVGGKVVFSAYARIPPITMKARPYLKPALAVALREFRGNVEAQLKLLGLAS